MLLIICWFLTGFYLFVVSLVGFLNFWRILMIAQKILFAVRVIGCEVCDISGMSIECVNISYVLAER
ncbi:hypothetical protein D3C76_1265330 [compost metagenome]